jgi:D-alanyl-D-alanine carboxypeptidase
VLCEGRAFNKLLLAEMLQGVTTSLGPETRYGLGVIIRQTPLGVSYGHSGFFPGYLTEAAYFPDLRVSVAVQINTSISDATSKPLAQVLCDFAQIAAGRPSS